MKIFLCFLLLFFITLPSSAFTLKGGVSYTVESARKEAFANVEYTLPQNIIDANRFDPNFQDNKVLIKNGVKETSDRFIEYFSDGSYGIVYKKNLFLVFGYNNDGKLETIDKRLSLICPTKSYQYNAKGKLEQVVLHISTKEGYIFSVDRKLIAYWLGDKCFDQNNKLIKTRY